MTISLNNKLSLRLQKLIALGPRPVFELLRELIAGADPLETVERDPADPDVVLD